MSRNCDGCGAEVADRSKFCPNCGKPMASGQPAGSADVPPPAGPAPSAAPRPVTSAASGPLAAGPLAAGPLAGNTGGPNIKLIAGCAGAGCLVFIIAIIVAIVVLVRSDNGNGGSEEGSGDTPQQPDKPQKSDLPDQPDLPEKPGQSDQPQNPEKPNPQQRPPWGKLPRNNPPSENVPKEGGLAQLVKKEVGRFTLIKTQRMNDIIGQGAVDALKLEYRADDGSGALHLLIAWSDVDQAQQAVDSTAEQATRQGWKVDENGVVKSQDGQEVGKVLILSNKKMKAQLCIWNHGQVFASVMAPAGVAKEFLNAVPY